MTKDDYKSFKIETNVIDGIESYMMDASGSLSSEDQQIREQMLKYKKVVSKTII